MKLTLYFSKLVVLNFQASQHTVDFIVVIFINTIAIGGFWDFVTIDQS